MGGWLNRVKQLYERVGDVVMCAAMAVVWMRDVLVVEDKWSLSALSTQMAQLHMVLPSPVET